jgi:hypothetical protein
MVPIWVAIVSGLFGVVASVGAALISNAAGGPITVNVGTQSPPGAGPTTATAALTTAPPTVAVSARTSVSAAPTGDQVAYLTKLQTTAGYTGSVGVFQISTQPYEQSFKKYCDTGASVPTTWSIAGYNEFTATVGIADNEENAVGAVAHIAIQDQDGRNLLAPFDVALGRPQSVQVAVQGVVQLQVMCSGRDSTGKPRGYFNVTFGTATLRR